MLRLLVPVIVLLVAVAVTVLSDAPARPADLTFINRGDVSTLDVQRMSWMQDLRVGRMLFEGLISNDIHSRDFAPRPGVAERWTVSDDGRTYTFFLRADAKWSNGSPVTAGHFVYAWRRAMLPDTASDYFKLFTRIRGAKAFYDWRSEELARFGKPGGFTDADELWRQTEKRFAETVELRAIDDRTFLFTLERPTVYFLDLCGFAVFCPVYPPLVSRYERPDPSTGRLDLQSGWTKPGRLVSNGPFKLAQWRFKRDMRLERNPHYWNPGLIAVDSINIPSIEDPNAQVLAFRSGTVDWVSDVTPPYRGDMIRERDEFFAEHAEQIAAWRAEGLDPVEIARRLPSDPRNTIHTFPAFGTYFYNFNCMPKLQDGRDNPFADARVRRAFAMAVDKERIVRQVRRIGESAVTTLIPVGSIPGYESPKGVPYDPAAARALLAEAGYPEGRGFITVDILFNKDAGHDMIAQAVAKDWQQNLGVSVALQQREIKVFRNDLKKQNYMVSRAGWFGDYGDPGTFLELSRSTDGNNDRKYNNPEYDALLDAADAATDRAERMRIMHKAESMIVDRDLPMIPIFQYVQVYLYDPQRVTGVSSHPRQQQDPFLFDILGDGKGPDTPKMIPPGDARPGFAH
jgi:oligopeptide transport system substrate-binding protein